MQRSQKYIFILWGNYFEEVAATIFTTQIRKAGLPVKVVGFSSKQTKGIYGMVLRPDLTLEQALRLASEVVCLIIPCTKLGLKTLVTEARLGKLLNQIKTNQGIFVIGALNDEDLTKVLPASIQIENVLVYPGNETLFAFASDVARQLKG